ncbi:HAD family hydrolase [Streptomyces sp. SID3343]|uniref:Cof-type HAD-IIB family hydrolase n=1 Tax=Streptomyces sp. SID3343 TaxID=2690260 RepID=UPI00136EEBC1|nr:Cof-type HAD-IIB family hydrolase [Streptomyces sp. SID3343]
MTFALVATDLDGTLLAGDHTVSARNLAALARVTASGADHVIVTGRAVPWTRPVFEAIGYQGLAVCGQGAQVYHVGEDRLLTSVTLDRQVARLATTKLSEELPGAGFAVSRDGVAGEVAVESNYAYDSLLPVHTVKHREELWDEPILKLYLHHPDYDDDQLTALARKICAGIVDVTHAGTGIVELLPLGLSKSVGLSIAARRLGRKAAETIAFGDMPNDLTMFKWVGHGVAMANAHPELLAVADEVTLSNEEDGVAVVLERLFPDA